MVLWIGLHILAAVIWVGGMFFAHMALRPAAASLEPPMRLMLMRGALQRFFVWIWIAIAALLLSGYAMIFLGFGGFANVGLHVHLMQLSGIVMMMLFAHVWFVPYRRLNAALATNDAVAAGKAMGQVRRVVAINLVLGLVTVLLGATGRYWG